VYDNAVLYSGPGGSQVYFIQTDKYYQAIWPVSFSSQPPANSDGSLNASYWAELKTRYSAEDYSNTRAYVPGEIVYYPVTGRFYACANATTGNLPTVTNFWGVLAEFDRYVAYEQTGFIALGHVLNAYQRNPRIFSNPEEVDFVLSENGVQIIDSVTGVWLRFRLKTPQLTGGVWSASATYAVGAQVYYSSATLAGNFYDCIEATSAGQSPDTHAAKWSIVEIPRIFQRYLEHGAYADYLTAEGQNEKAPLESKRAEMMLAQQSFVLANQQQQRQRTVVLTR
jgi:hypothetical protein